MASLSTPFRPSDLPTGLLAYWKLNNGATDSSGNGYNLSAVNAPTYTANGNYWKDEYCGVSTAASKYWSLTNASATALKLLNTDFTIFGWYKAGATTIGEVIGMNNVTTTGWWLYIVTNGTNRYMRFATAGENTDLSSGGDIWDNVSKWVPFAITFNKTTKVMCGYAHGNLVHTSTRSNGIGDTAGDFLLSDGATANLKDFAIWNTILTPIQIKSLAMGVDLSTFAYRPGSVPTPPMSWWKLNEISLSANRVDAMGRHDLVNQRNGAPHDLVAVGYGYVEGVGTQIGISGSWNESCWSPSSADYTPGTGDYSVVGWAWIDTVGGGQPCFFGLGSGHSSGASIGLNAGTQIEIFVNGTSYKWNWTPTARVFYHLAFKRASGVLYAYVDGVSLGAGQASTENITSTTFNMGYEPDGWRSVKPGNYCDIAFWKGYALTDAEIKSLACALPIQKTGIVSYWKLEDLTDSIGPNTLTNNNTVTFGTGLITNGAGIVNSGSKYLSIADASQSGLDPVSDFCVMGWAKRPSGGGRVMSKWDGNNGYEINVDAGASLNGTINAAAVSWNAGASVGFGTWNHYCLNLDMANKYIYFNAVGYSNSQTAAVTDTAFAFQLGGYNGANTIPTEVDDEWIFTKRYFRPEEIKAVYLKGLNGKLVTSSEISETSIKKICGVAYASIKKVSGLAIASCKKVIGVA